MCGRNQDTRDRGLDTAPLLLRFMVLELLGCPYFLDINPFRPAFSEAKTKVTDAIFELPDKPRLKHPKPPCHP